MKKIVLVGNVACGKTTLCQRLNGLKLQYEKTQALNVVNCTIDTPGEYLEHRSLMRGLTVVSADTDYVVFVQDASRDLYLYSPGQAAAFPCQRRTLQPKSRLRRQKSFWSSPAQTPFSSSAPIQETACRR